MKVCIVEKCDRQKKGSKYCGLHYERMRLRGRLDLKSTSERLTERLKLNKKNNCLEWQGSLGTGGYGLIRVNGKLEKAHRVAFGLVNIPSGLFVCHHCDNPKCCNTDHLFLGTHQDNVDDRENKGRNRPPKGELQGRSKLTETQVLNIRASSLTQKELSGIYDVHPSAIHLIKARKNWKHI